jgi:hypothetical protein
MTHSARRSGPYSIDCDFQNIELDYYRGPRRLRNMLQPVTRIISDSCKVVKDLMNFFPLDKN